MWRVLKFKGGRPGWPPCIIWEGGAASLGSAAVINACGKLAQRQPRDWGLFTAALSPRGTGCW